MGIDVNGTIGRLKFKKGLGDPTGVNTLDPAESASESGESGDLPATQYGIPQGSTGYPAAGYLGATIKATHIHKISVKPANVLVQTPQDPTFVQPQNQGIPLYIPSPGYALSNVIIATSGSIDNVSILGSSLYSEVKSGFSYSNYVAGLEGTVAASKINNLNINGDLISSPISATYRPSNGVYSHGAGTFGNGTIKGKYAGKYYVTGTEGQTGLNNVGAGLFARHVKVKRAISDLDDDPFPCSDRRVRSSPGLIGCRRSVRFFTSAREWCPSSTRHRSRRSGSGRRDRWRRRG